MDQENLFVQKLILQKIKRSDKDKKKLSQQETVSVLQYVASTRQARPWQASYRSTLAVFEH